MSGHWRRRSRAFGAWPAGCTPYDFACSLCEAAPGENCLVVSGAGRGRVSQWPHTSRCECAREGSQERREEAKRGNAMAWLLVTPWRHPDGGSARERLHAALTARPDSGER